jgi:1,4-dihydroxy-2-naphthoyl-CoA hydrolase
VSLRADITLDILNERGQGYFPGQMGIEVQALTPGCIYARMPVVPHLLAPNGFLHAAAVIALADTACGYGTIAHLPDGAKSFTTIELKSNFLGTATEGALLCEARAEHMGRATQVWDATVTDEGSGRKIALFRCTQMILWPK